MYRLPMTRVALAVHLAVASGLWFAPVAPTAASDVWVADSRAGTACPGQGGVAGCGAVFRVDPTTGQRTLVSDFGNAAQGPLGGLPMAAAFDALGLLVLDQSAGTDCTGGGFG